MGLFARLLGTDRDKDEQAALWQQIVAIAREPEWYVADGAADTVAGRFDVITLVTALVLIRMDGVDMLRRPSARLTERFVADMDGQLRQEGVGDLVVGKRIGKLMQALAGRLEAYRAGLCASDHAVLIDSVRRNVSMAGNGNPERLAARMRSLHARLAQLSDLEIAEGRIGK